MTGADLLVLRFRDIELPHGETILRHRLAIADHGEVWWGWLSRPYERNPRYELNHFRAVRPDSFEIALYDSGMGFVYIANCEEIRTGVHDIRSPDYDLTPEYYRSRKARAWFRLSHIEKKGEEMIVGRTCVALPSASEECHTDILNRKITNLRDLRRQEVTMWVVR